MSQQFCLKWNNHMNNMMDVFKNLLSTEAMVDVTLACDGLSLKAHKIVLSACSPFFQSLFLENPCKHPIVILKDMKYTELKAIIEFMYHGEVNVAQDQLSALMKTAETLRVKGLAEVQNEKQTNSTDEPSHRSVPRTDTPPPSKRRRGRTRKRSVSDVSDDEASEPKIKQPDSDIEELSGDMDASSSQYSNVQTTAAVPMQTISSHTSNSFHKSSQQQDQPVDQGADESFAQEEKFGVEPSKLLEQTLTTDDLPRRSGRSSVQSNMSEMSVQRRPRTSTDHSTALVPTSVSSDALVVSNQQPESPPDIKPELLELDPPMSPVAGPSHSTDENSMMMYMDQSSMSGMPGPSGYQDNSALVSTDSQPQGFFIKSEESQSDIETLDGSDGEATNNFSQEKNKNVSDEECIELEEKFLIYDGANSFVEVLSEREFTEREQASDSKLKKKRRKEERMQKKQRKKKRVNANHCKEQEATALSIDKEHLASNGEQIPEKQLNAVLCKEKCRLNCTDQFDSEQRRRLLSQFYEFDVNTKNAFIFSCTGLKTGFRKKKATQKPKLATCYYQVACDEKVTRVCKTAFCTLFQIRKSKIELLQRFLKDGLSSLIPNCKNKQQNHLHKRPRKKL